MKTKSGNLKHMCDMFDMLCARYGTYVLIVLRVVFRKPNQTTINQSIENTKSSFRVYSKSFSDFAEYLTGHLRQLPGPYILNALADKLNI